MPGTSSIALVNVQCSGDEPSLDNCTLPSFFLTGCSHSEDVGVDCLGRRRKSPVEFSSLQLPSVFLTSSS